MSATSVTVNVLSRIRDSGGREEVNPVLQVLTIKKMAPGTNASERYRLVLSDSVHHQNSMLATQQNYMVANQELRDLCLVRVEEFIVNTVQDKSVLIILRLAVVGYLNARIGGPLSIDGGGTEAPAYAAPSNGGGGPVAAAPYGGAGGYGSGANPYGQANGGGGNGGNPYGGSGGITATNGYGPGGGAGKGGGGSGASSGYGAAGCSGGSNPYGGGGGGSASSFARGGGGGSGPVERRNQSFFTPISQVNPYQNRWTIKARVTSKGDIRAWSNQRGEGQLFSIEMLDEAGGEIRATFFRDAVDKYYNMIEQGRVYTFSGGQVKVANKQYSSVNNEYEIAFSSNAEIQPVADDPSIRAAVFKFVKIAELANLPPNSMCDVIGILKDFSDCANITTKAGKSMDKRNLTLVDDSFAEVKATLWGGHAKLADDSFQGTPVVAFKGVKVSDFGGVSLGTYASTNMMFNPPVPETQELRQWWDAAGVHGGGSFKALTSGGGSGAGGGRDTFEERRPISHIREYNLGHAEAPDYLSVKATVTFIKHDQESGGPWYTACPQEGCNKKVTASMDDNWHCEKCNQTYPNCNRRYILKMTLTDDSGLTWATSFNDTGVSLMGKTAEELNMFKTNGQEAAFEAAFFDACWQQLSVRLRLKAEVVKDEERVSATVMRLAPIQMVPECASLIAAINKYD